LQLLFFEGDNTCADSDSVELCNSVSLDLVGIVLSCWQFRKRVARSKFRKPNPQWRFGTKFVGGCAKNGNNIFFRALQPEAVPAVNLPLVFEIGS
jgi:hypothetical protein